MDSQNRYCVFVLTHGRPGKVLTIPTLERAGFRGDVRLVIDDEDATADEYYRKFGRDRVVMFSKREVAAQIDEFDNFDDRRAILYARNACFDLAERLGYEWFLELDDDYTAFVYRVNGLGTHPIKTPIIKRTLQGVIDATFRLFQSLDGVASIAFSQGGDWCGGRKNFGKPIRRKAMNSFFCSTRRRFKFVGRINEDVNTYVWSQSQGLVFFTLPHIQLNQVITQKNAGGMSDIYLDSGTYVKSFYTVMCAPSSVTINVMGKIHRRIHHAINWPYAVPLILSESIRK